MESVQEIAPEAQQILSDPRALRGSILMEHLRGNDSLDGYSSLCDIFGKEFMEYNHFLYWFDGLADGTLTLDSIDRFSPQAVPRSFQATIDKITNIKDVYVYFGEFVIFVNENQWRYHNRGEDFTLVTFDSTDYEEKYDYLVDNKMP
ncbi:Mos1 transposase HTH domain-containing protein [Caenorhabditis elegans]|uniref:Mos1 transposase HTH domain-containing protein n=1 Tax=Caenorhabditis elegans TaxID=6239 RepID=O44559_CAEEL|nr:Mos1 transposase HTH domain-containing protein [Caenorhabditis elegans]CCD72113.1 Mos1 transposase HTH domain-containing protein [Caenorhabditis elegans]|eukprot:NP_503541.2 F-box A protein [Caenorhabditis elegans]